MAKQSTQKSYPKPTSKDPKKQPTQKSYPIARDKNQ